MDPRSRRTQEALVNAFTELIGVKPLKSITITELSEKAGVTRAAFYAHYRDTSELLEEIRRQIVDYMDSALDRHMQEIFEGDTSGISSDIFMYFNEHERFFSLLSGSNGDPSFLTAALNSLCEKYNEKLCDLLPQAAVSTVYEDAFRLQFAFNAAGFIYLLDVWLASDRRYSAEDMASVASAFLDKFGGVPSDKCIEQLSKSKNQIAPLPSV